MIRNMAKHRNGCLNLLSVLIILRIFPVIGNYNEEPNSLSSARSNSYHQTTTMKTAKENLVSSTSNHFQYNRDYLMFHKTKDIVSKIETTMIPTTTNVQILEETTDNLINKKESLYDITTPVNIRSAVCEDGYTICQNDSPRNTSKASFKSGISRIKRSLININTFSYNSTTNNYDGTTESIFNAGEFLQNDTCKLFSICEVASRKEIQFCNCDRLCSVYGDCCLDANVTSITSDYQFQCTRMTDYARFLGVPIVTKCPENMTGSEIDLKCRDSYIPNVGTWVMDDEEMVYQNRYCAQCFNKVSYRSFGLNASSCRHNRKDDFINNPNITSEEKLEKLVIKCKYLSLIPPSGSSPRYCLLFERNTDKNDYCDKYFYNPVVAFPGSPQLSTGRLHRNRFCVPEEIKKVTCIAQSDVLEIEKDERNPIAFPLTVLFSSKRSKLDCTDGNAGSCQNDEFMITQSPLDLMFDFVIPTNWTTLQKLQVAHSLMLSLGSELAFRLAVCYEHEMTKNVACTIWVIWEKGSKHYSLFQYQENMVNYTWRNIITLLDGNVVDTYIIPLTELDMTKLNVIAHFKPDFVKYFVYNINNVIVLSNKTQDTCFNKRLKSEMTNETLVIKNIRCLEKALYNKKTQYSGKIQIIITYVGMVISVIALTLSIICNRITGMCESIPGSNIENISVSLLAFTIGFLVGIGVIDYSPVCFTIGVILHYLWMTMFAFKSITLIYICCNLTTFSSISAARIRTRKMIYTIIGLTLPLPFLVSAILLDVFGLSGFQVNYGGSVCFPNGYPANFVFVLGPIGLSILTNIVCFLVVIGIVTRQSIISRNIRKTSSYEHLPIFARLSALTGMFWITGVLWSFFPSETLEYIFLVSCSFQGLLVAISNLSTKKTVKSIRDRISSRSTDKLQTS